MPFVDLRLGVCRQVGHVRLDQPSCSKMQVRGSSCLNGPRETSAQTMPQDYFLGKTDPSLACPGKTFAEREDDTRLMAGKASPKRSSKKLTALAGRRSGFAMIAGVNAARAAAARPS
jgi:hypothetical protein